MAVVLITDKSGNGLVELENANVDDVVWELNEPGSCQFEVPVDDPKLTEYGVTNMLTANQASGTDALGNTSQFVTFGTNTLASSTAQAIQGSRSLQATVPTGGDLRLMNLASGPVLVAGDTYLFSVWVYVPSSWSGNPALWFSTDGGNAQYQMVVPYNDALRNQWQRIVGRLTADANQNYNALLRATVLPGSSSSIWIDQLLWERENVARPGVPSGWVAGATSTPTIYYPRGSIDEIQIWDSDILMWWGLLETLRMNKQTLTATCAGLLAYMFKRFVTNTSLTYTSIDQFTIAWNLFLFAQTGTDRDFNIDNATYAPSGKIRSRDYPRDEHANLFDLLQEFPKLELGFDFDIDIYGDGRREFHPYYPRKGTFKGAFPFEWGVNIDDFEGIEDFVEQANKAYVTGGTSGDVKFEANYRDNTAAARDGEMEKIISEGSQNDVNELSEIAQKEVNASKDPVKLPTITTPARFPTDLLMNVFTGDTIRVGIDHGRAQFQGNLRVRKKTWKPKEEKIAWELTV